MRKAFIMAGSAFLLAMILISSAGYVAYSKRILEKSVYERMVIDKINNRAVDIYRVIQEKSVDYLTDNLTENCTNLNNTGLLGMVLQMQEVSANEGLNFSYSYYNVSSSSGLRPCLVTMNYSVSLDKSKITQTLEYQMEYRKEKYFNKTCDETGCRI